MRVFVLLNRLQSLIIQWVFACIRSRAQLYFKERETIWSRLDIFMSIIKLHFYCPMRTVRVSTVFLALPSRSFVLSYDKLIIYCPEDSNGHWMICWPPVRNTWAHMITMCITMCQCIVYSWYKWELNKNLAKWETRRSGEEWGGRTYLCAVPVAAGVTSECGSGHDHQ